MVDDETVKVACEFFKKAYNPEFSKEDSDLLNDPDYIEIHNKFCEYFDTYFGKKEIENDTLR